MLRAIFLLFLFVGVCLSVNVDHVILSLTGVTTEMAVSFRLDGAPAGNPVIKYGTGASSMKTLTVTNVKHVIESPSAKAPILYLGSATMTGLAANTEYEYSITPDSKSKTASYRFKTFPSGNFNKFNIAFFGDIGSASPNLKAGTGTVVDFASKKQINLVVHYGDIAYNLHTAEGQQGTEYLQKATSWSAEIPYMVSQGNHEYESEVLGNGQTLSALSYYNHYFAAQSAAGSRSKSTNPMVYYSFNVGSVHIVMLNTELACTRSYNAGSSSYYVENTNVNLFIDQYNWAVADLAAAAASGRWIIVTAHRQIHTYESSNWPMTMIMDGIDCSGSCKLEPCPSKTASTCKYGLGAAIFKYQVDLILQGHAHMYERYYPAGHGIWERQTSISKIVNPQHPVSIVSGNPGAQSTTFSKRSMDGQEDLGYEVYIHDQPYNGTYADFVASQDAEDRERATKVKLPPTCPAVKYAPTGSKAAPYGWTLVEVVSATQLNVQYIHTGSGKSLDSFTITHSGKSKAVTKAFAYNKRTDQYCGN